MGQAGGFVVKVSRYFLHFAGVEETLYNSVIVTLTDKN